MTAVMRIAGRSKSVPVVKKWPVSGSKSNGAEVSACGIDNPKLWRKSWKWADHPCATVDEPTAYSSTRSHPMIQAINSPSVA